jgi:cell wall-associated NlpC family hydrolase
MSTTTLSPVPPRRVTSVLITALFGLTLALIPISAPKAEATVTSGTAVRALNVAYHQLGVPYKWGGTSHLGFDCSGLTRYAYHKIGTYLPRTAQQQYQATLKIKAGTARAGDLVFFYSGSTVYHVGIYAGNGYVIHAPRTGKLVSKVKIWTSKVYIRRVR